MMFHCYADWLVDVSDMFANFLVALDYFQLDKKKIPGYALLAYVIIEDSF